MECLFYGETPVIETGAARVSRAVLTAMCTAGIHPLVVGINHYGIQWYSAHLYPYDILPVKDPSRMHNQEQMLEELARFEGELVFLTGDANVLLSLLAGVISWKERHPSGQVWTLLALDTAVFHAGYLDVFDVSDRCFTYSEFARAAALAHRPDFQIDVIKLGSEPEHFYPLDTTERTKVRRELFHLSEDTFLVVNVNRNQPRKDLARTLKAFQIFHEKQPNSKLYLHAKQEDLAGHLPTQAKMIGLQVEGPDSPLIFAGGDYEERLGVDRVMLNKIYNAADVCVSTSWGEAWGLTTSEAMCAGTPFIGPRNSTFLELLGEHGERGLLAECGGDDLWVLPYGHSEGPREIVSCIDMAALLTYVYSHPLEASRMARAALASITTWTWSDCRDAWRTQFAELRREEA